MTNGNGGRSVTLAATTPDGYEVARTIEDERPAPRRTSAPHLVHRAFIHQMTDAFALIDRELRLVDINDRAMEALGLPLSIRRQVLGRKLRTCAVENVPAPSMIRIRSIVERCLLGETIEKHEIDANTATGGRRYFLINASPILDDQGRVEMALLVGRDITDEVCAQRQVREIYRREHAIAEKLQSSFLAQDYPGVSTFEIGANYKAGLDEALVGGDFYDMFRVGDEKLAIVIADVAGKGLKAAVYTAMTKYMLRAYALEQSAPELVLARLNEALSACTPPEVFVTLIYGILDGSDRTFTFGNAGHELPLLFSARQRMAVALDVTGRALALANGSSYTTHTIGMDTGDALVLYTDGVTDAGSGANRLGADSLLAVLESYHHLTAGELSQMLLDKAVHFAGGKLADDAALLTIKAVSGEKQNDA